MIKAILESLEYPFIVWSIIFFVLMAICAIPTEMSGWYRPAEKTSTMDNKPLEDEENDSLYTG